MDLATTKREITGKKVRALRREGFIPAELYGHGLANEHLSVSAKEFGKVFKEAGSATVVTLLVGQDKKPALIHEVQRDFLSGDVAHIDFYQVRMDEVITAKVPLEFTGESKAVKEQQAMVTKAMTELEVEALPGDLPHNLKVDLALLDDLNKSIYVKDIAVPKGVKVLVDAETAVATATPPVKEEVAAPAPEAVAAGGTDVSAVKVETEEKVAERAAGKKEEAK
jgi:large subunit ribosomal protein L25